MDKVKRFNEATLRKRSHPKFNVPVIGHSGGSSILYKSILEAEEITDISYHMIFDACIGRTRTAGLMHWEYENGRHWIKYKAKLILGQRILRYSGFNG
jgi:hypothetical protein